MHCRCADTRIYTRKNAAHSGRKLRHGTHPGSATGACARALLASSSAHRHANGTARDALMKRTMLLKLIAFARRPKTRAKLPDGLLSVGQTENRLADRKAIAERPHVNCMHIQNNPALPRSKGRADVSLDVPAQHDASETEAHEKQNSGAGVQP